ncbi:MAG TPA: hypothetical protein PKD02_03120, partial [Thermomonas sp.]|nr:hypothetical protein [Thermomonas sp.]
MTRRAREADARGAGSVAFAVAAGRRATSPRWLMRLRPTPARLANLDAAHGSTTTRMTSFE